MDALRVYSEKQENQIARSPQTISTRKATSNDVASIYKIACSVGTKTKKSQAGFLMDDYAAKPKHYQKFFFERLLELDHFYIAEGHQALGFLMAYTKDQWLKYNPTWIEDINWRPDFNMKKTDNFVVIDKTAILSNLTGKGIGSLLYKQLIKDLKAKGIQHIFAETIISPVPNFASLAFREKQKYTLAGMRYEEYNGTMYTDLIYYKPVELMM
ncbi:MAG: GNAT family N-acetyltransferase [Bacillota bacterium]